VRNYYEILGVKHNSSYDEIKKTFRKKAKEIHPDVVASKNMQSEEAMKLLLKAYEVLSNPRKREDYDYKLKALLRTFTFNYREFLKERKDDLQSQATLILYDLMHGNPDEAIETYNAFFGETPDEMEKYMNRTDYLECIFLLAEEFDKREDYLASFCFLKKICEYENEKPFFKHFTAEIIERLKHLVCFKLVNLYSIDLSIRYIKQLISLNLSIKDNAFLYKRIAELYLISGNKKNAFAFLQKCLKLGQKLNGLSKLKAKIGNVE
jgi:tetratricopeptide (TPR) repeat protein